MPTESGCWTINVPASRTLDPKAGPASFAESVGPFVLAAASQTLHQWPLRLQRMSVHPGVVIPCLHN